MKVNPAGSTQRSPEQPGLSVESPCLKNKQATCWEVVFHTFNPITQQAEVGTSQSSLQRILPSLPDSQDYIQILQPPPQNIHTPYLATRSIQTKTTLRVYFT